MRDAIDALSEVVISVDKSKLEQTLATANATSTNGKTDESVQILNAAIEKAETLLADENATQEEIDEAVESLEQAIAGLEDLPVVNKEALKEVIKEARNVDLTGKTQVSINKLLQLINKGLLVLQRDDVTQEEVDAVITEIKAAIEGLEDIPEPVVVDKARLEEVLDTAYGIDTNAKTEESVKVLEESIRQAEKVLHRIDLLKKK